MKKVILFSSVALACGILFANIFNSMVISEAVKSDIPNSVVAAREYFKTVNPGDFFKIFSPLTQVFTLLSLILFWKTGKIIFRDCYVIFQEIFSLLLISILGMIDVSLRANSRYRNT